MLLVRSVAGPARVVGGKKAVYRVASYNLSDPPAAEKKKINWLVVSGEEEVARFEAAGEEITFEVPTALIGKTIRVMAFRKSPAPFVSVVSEVIEDDAPGGTPGRVIVLSRDEWGAKPLPRLGNLVDRRKRREVFIHHTVIVDGDATINEWEDLDEVKAKMQQLQTIRAADLGKDVPYNFVAFCMANGDLVLGEGRGLDRSGAHTVGHNQSAIAVSFQGNFEKAPLPAKLDSQLAALGNWLRDLRTREGFVNLGVDHPLGRDVFGHREVKSTDCPGEEIFTRLKLIRFL
jgi:hypothetical protein